MFICRVAYTVHNFIKMQNTTIKSSKQKDTNEFIYFAVEFPAPKSGVEQKKNKYFKNVQSLADLQKQLNKMYHLYSHKLWSDVPVKSSAFQFVRGCRITNKKMSIFEMINNSLVAKSKHLSDVRYIHSECFQNEMEKPSISGEDT